VRINFFIEYLSLKHNDAYLGGVYEIVDRIINNEMVQIWVIL